MLKSKVKKMDKVDGPNAHKSEWIKLEQKYYMRRGLHMGLDTYVNNL
jgi:hypothetical protein